MKKEKLFEILGDLDEKDIRAAGEYRKKRKKAWIRWGIPALCAALLLAVLPSLGKRGDEPVSTVGGMFTVKAEYPEPVNPEMDVLYRL